MRIIRAGRWIGLAAGLWAAAVAAQEAPDPVVLTVLGTNYTARELGNEAGGDPERLVWRAYGQIHGGIMGAFIGKRTVQPSEEELKEYCRRSAPTPEEMAVTFGNSHAASLSADEIAASFWDNWQRDADDPDGPMRLAARQWEDWKINQALFERYGGRVWAATYRVPVAYDAVRALLAEREGAGDFTIHDAELRERFWELVRMPPPVPLVSEEEGRVALAEHPADRQKRQAIRDLREHLRREKEGEGGADAEPAGILDRVD